jgi:hypothetical protein
VRVAARKATGKAANVRRHRESRQCMMVRSSRCGWHTTSSLISSCIVPTARRKLTGMFDLLKIMLYKVSPCTLARGRARLGFHSMSWLLSCCFSNRCAQMARQRFLIGRWRPASWSSTVSHPLSSLNDCP